MGTIKLIKEEPSFHDMVIWVYGLPEKRWNELNTEWSNLPNDCFDERTTFEEWAYTNYFELWNNTK